MRQNSTSCQPRLRKRRRRILSLALGESWGSASSRLRRPTRCRRSSARYADAVMRRTTTRAIGRGRRPSRRATAVTSQYSILSHMVRAKDKCRADERVRRGHRPSVITDSRKARTGERGRPAFLLPRLQDRETCGAQTIPRATCRAWRRRSIVPRCGRTVLRPRARLPGP